MGLLEPVRPPRRCPCPRVRTGPPPDPAASASTAATCARSWSGSVVIATLTLVDGCQQQRPTLQRLARCVVAGGDRHSGLPLVGAPHRVRGRPHHRQFVLGILPGGVHGDRVGVDVDPPGRVGPDARSASASACNPRRSAARYPGRSAGAACTASLAVLTPVSTIRLGSPAATAPAMSVSSRSPTTSGVAKVPRLNASFISVGWGLPATSGFCWVATCNAATIEPLPGSNPRSEGSVRSTLAATQQRSGADGQRGLGQVRPRGVRRVPLHHRDRTLVERAGTGRSPTLDTSPASASVPTTRTAESGGTWAANKCAALCALVTTSSEAAANPRSRKCSATCSGARDALLVTYSTRAATPARLWNRT